MNSHRRLQETLARRAELTPAHERRLREHLERCPECRETAAAYEHQWQLLQSLPPLETPPTLRASVLNRIHAAPQSTVAWYRSRAGLMAPLAAAAVLALAGGAWVAGSRITAQHGNHNALSSRAATPTPKSGGRTPVTFGSPFSSSAPTRPVEPKRSVVSHPTRHPTGTVNEGRSPSRVGKSPAATPRIAATSLSGAVRSTATPVLFGSKPSVAANVQASPIVPTLKPHAGTRVSGRHASPQSRPSRATSRPQATAAPISGPVGIAVGPPSSPAPAPNPPRAAPIRGTPSPLATAPSVPPVIAVTPGTVNTPMPIISPTGTPSPVAAVHAGPSTPTPTPTSTAHP